MVQLPDRFQHGDWMLHAAESLLVNTAGEVQNCRLMLAPDWCRAWECSPRGVMRLNHQMNGKVMSTKEANTSLEIKGASKISKRCFTSREEKEKARLLIIRRKKDFFCLDHIDNQPVNILEGLELHTNVFNRKEQKRVVDFIHELQKQGRNQELRGRTYSEPRKWMRGKGRVTIQFGCCYNYAVDKEGNPPGIVGYEQVDEIPSLFRLIVKRLVQWRVLPASCIPDSCIVNIYDAGDCIPPHIDHHDFVRPFCTLSLLSECNIVFGSNLDIVGPGEFEGSFSLPLPVGSVLVLNGNGADIAKHAIPAVPSKRISITFRKMDPSKRPYGYSPDFELLHTEPIHI